MSNKEIIEKAILGGVIGAALGALFSKDAKSTVSAAVAGAALAASISALSESQESGEEVLFVREGKMFKVFPNGKEVFIKNMPTSSQPLPKGLKIEK
jgi:hypothetical protein